MATIYYHDIGDYLSREEKLTRIRNNHSISGMQWETLAPNEKQDWINLRDESFDDLISITPDKNKGQSTKSFFSMVAIGVATNRDSWSCNFSKNEIEHNIKSCITHYNEQREKYHREASQNSSINIEDFVNADATKISWTRALRRYLGNDTVILFDRNKIFYYQYRPFQKQYVYYQRYLVESPGIWENVFPTSAHRNLVICVSCVKTPTVILTNCLTDLHFDGDSQCFPLYWYEENKNKQKSLFDAESSDDYIRRDGITDWILTEVRTRYGTRNITKEMIFYYVYGLLHSKDYRERFAADLKKSLPRIPIVDSLDDFMDFYKAGKALADLHLNYETVAPCPDVVVHGDRQIADDGAYNYFRVVDKMRFRSKNDKSVIIYNGNITIENIPQKAYEYIVNGKSAIEWIVERYAVTIDKKSLIKNDANDWAREHGKPRYILDLLLSVINVSVQTVDIVNSLPKLKFD